MNKIIFLDFDGVLNSMDNMNARYVTARNNGYFPAHIKDVPDYVDKYGHIFDERCVRWLAHIIHETNAKLVISSSWRRQNVKQMWLDRNLPGEVIDITPWFESGKRGTEIKHWMDNTDIDIESFCIIDDVPFDIEELHPENFVKTNLTFGLCSADARKSIYILNNEDKKLKK